MVFIVCVRKRLSQFPKCVSEMTRPEATGSRQSVIVPVVLIRQNTGQDLISRESLVLQSSSMTPGIRVQPMLD